MLASSRSTAGKSYFWTGMFLGATLTVLGFTWWQGGFESMDDGDDDEDAIVRERGVTHGQNNIRKRSMGKPSKMFARGMSLLQRSSTKSIRNVLTNTSFLSNIMEQLWPYIKVAGADTIRTSVEPSFVDLPGPMKTCHFTKIDLGNVPVRMDNIVVHPLQPDGSVQFDLDVIWDGDCDFQLKADYIGKFGIRRLKLNGRMAIILKPLTNDLPIVAGIQYSFINMPEIDLSFSGMASVAELSVLESTVQQALKSGLSTSVLPCRRLYKMNAENNFLDTYQPPLGVLRLTVQDGTGFVIEKRIFAKDDIPDVYLNVTLGALPEIWRTKTIMDNLNPVWDETADFCLYDREQQIRIHAWDEDDGPLDPDDDLGVATVPVAEMLLSPMRTVTLPLILHDKKEKKNMETGALVTMTCNLCQWTTDLSSLESSSASNNIRNEICGLLVVIVNRAFDLPLDRKAACTFVKVSYADKEYPSKMIYDYPGWDSLNPRYDTGITIPILTDMPRDDNADVKLELIDTANEKDKENVLGSIAVNFATLKSMPDNTLTERKTIGSGGAQLEYRVSLSGVMLAPKDKVAAVTTTRSALSPGTSSPTRTIQANGNGKQSHFSFDQGDSLGIFRLTVVQARGLRIQEEFFGFDVPDAFCEVFFEGEKFTTSVKHNNVTPIWNESKDWKLLDHGQIITIKAWDRNEREEDPDICVGSAKTTVGKLLLAGGSLELELLDKNGRPHGVFVTLQGEMVQ